jgi:hypothetical protein
MKEYQSKVRNINLKDAGNKRDLGRDGTSEDGTGFSLVREVKKKKTCSFFVVPFDMSGCGTVMRFAAGRVWPRD